MTAASRGGSSTAASRRREEFEGLEEEEEDAYGDAGPPSPSSSGYAGERGSSLASSTGAGGIEEPDASPPLGPGAEDWAQGKKHADEVLPAPLHLLILQEPLLFNYTWSLVCLLSYINHLLTNYELFTPQFILHW